MCHSLAIGVKSAMIVTDMQSHSVFDDSWFENENIPVVAEPAHLVTMRREPELNIGES